MYKFLTSLCLVVCATFCLSMAQSTTGQLSKSAEESIPSGWRVYATGDLDSAALACLNNARTDWQVLLESGELKIVEYKPQSVDLPPLFKLEPSWRRARKQVLKIEDGWLVGINGGEWGGGLWITNETSSETKLLVRENVEGIVPTEHGILVFSGLAHLGSNFGDVVLISNPRNLRVNLEWLAHLDSVPVAFAKQPDDSVLFATNYSVSRLLPPPEPGQSEKMKQLFFLKQFRSYLFWANSIAKAADGSIYLGSRGVVARIPADYTEGGLFTLAKEEFLIPKDCGNDPMKQRGCTCLQ